MSAIICLEDKSDMYTRLEEEEGITWKQVHKRNVLLMYRILYCKLDWRTCL